MIAKIIEYSAKNRFIVLLIVSFAVLWGYWALTHTPLDAIPDLSDTQVIVYTEWAGRSPDLIEDQVTYPITSTLLAAPQVRAVRGYSFFGSSFIYVIFKDGTDIYWARTRVLEYLQSIRNKVPADVNPVLGPDASSVGWGFSYALVDESGNNNLSMLRSVQDWNLKLALESVPGVSQVASIGGFVKQYQINIDPNRLLAYNVPITKVLEAVRKSNRDVEGRVIEFSGIEYMVRGKGYIKTVSDLEKVTVGSDGAGTPIYLKDVAQIQLGPEIRRGLADLDGKGEVAGGIVIVRFGENMLDVLERVKKKLKQDIEPSLPKGVRVVTTYDRSDLIRHSISNLRNEIIWLSIIVSVVCAVFLFHFPSALVVISTLPVAILASFICMYYLKVTSNIMSLSGIAIAIGAMVDASIIMVENAHKKLEEYSRGSGVGDQGSDPGTRVELIITAAKEVGPSLFFALLVITVAFLPVFSFQAQAGRLMRPLAYTKTFAMFFASFLAITLTPVLMTFLIRGNIRSEEGNPVSLFLRRVYEPVASFALRSRRAVIIGAVVAVLATTYPFIRLGSEFMPPLFEETLFYMPVTVPAGSISEAAKLLQTQDKILKSFPEVVSVFGKAGRAETPTDPAPLEMYETVINLKPKTAWRKGVTWESLTDQMNDALTIPGVANSFTMPIKARIDMLSTGIRTPLGIKVLGPRIEEVERIGIEVEGVLKGIKGTRSVFAERVTTGYFLDFDIDRDEAARYGLNIDDVQSVIESATGGMNLTTTVEGRERYPVNVRYARDFREDIDALKRVPLLVEASQGAGTAATQTGLTAANGQPLTLSPQLVQVPLGQLADIRVRKGPAVIQSEEGLLASRVYVDISGRDVGSYVNDARKKLASLKVPEGYRFQWSGEYEYLQRTYEGLKFMLPFTVLLIFALIYFNTKSMVKTIIVLLAVPFSLVGSFWLLYILNYNMSTAVWVGLIALAGLDAETGVVMLLYLDLAYEKWQREGRLNGIADLQDAIMYGAVKRIRPKIMTVSVILAGLIPIMFSDGAGSDVMKRIAAPMIGGVVTSMILELIVYPVVFMVWRGRAIDRKEEREVLET